MINRCSRFLLIACVTGATLSAASGSALAARSSNHSLHHTLIAQAESPTAKPKSDPKSPEAKDAKPESSGSKGDWIWWAATGFVLIAVGGGTVYGLTRLNPMAATEQPKKKPSQTAANASPRKGARSLPPAKPSNRDLRMQRIEARQAELRQAETAHEPEVTIIPPHREDTSYSNTSHAHKSQASVERMVEESPTIFISPADIAEHKAVHKAAKKAGEAPSRLSKIDIIEDLINDLYSPDGAKRRKAIWELGQMGDSRAVQPLADLMIDSDSAQRSLILGAMSEVAMRTIKPLHQALLISMQDNNADVRKNAVRDVTRVYEMVGQISQLLHHAANDPDPEVQETAKWALGQLNHMRSLPQMENLPVLPTNGNGNGSPKYVNGKR
jgi:hypothetical protein